MPIRQIYWVFESPQGPIIGLENTFPSNCFLQEPVKVVVNRTSLVCTISTYNEQAGTEVSLIRTEICGVEIMVGQPLNPTIPRARP